MRFLGAPESGADYLDVFMKTGKERDVVESLYHFLFGPGLSAWDELRLSDLPAESLFLMHFMNILESHGKFVEVRRHAYLPQTLLPRTVAEFFTTLSSHRRARLRKDMRHLVKETEFEFREYRGEDIQEALSRFFNLYNAVTGYQDGPRLEHFLRNLSAQGESRNWVQVDMLTVAGRDVAALLNLRHASNVGVLKMVVDKTFMPQISVGNLLVSMSMQGAIERGAICYDFLKGDEDYKFHWVRRGRATLSIRVTRRHWKPVTATIVRLLKYMVKVAVR